MNTPKPQLDATDHDRDSAGILQQLERPKPERSLPKVLNRAQVNQLIHQLDAVARRTRDGPADVTPGHQ